jgi:hypothetical protein
VGIVIAQSIFNNPDLVPLYRPAVPASGPPVAKCDEPVQVADGAGAVTNVPLTIQPNLPTEGGKNWESVGTELILKHGGKDREIKTMGALFDRMKKQGYPNTRQALYKLQLVVQAANAAGICAAKLRKRTPPKGFRASSGSVDCIDNRTGTE